MPNLYFRYVGYIRDVGVCFSFLKINKQNKSIGMSGFHVAISKRIIIIIKKIKLYNAHPASTHVHLYNY